MNISICVFITATSFSKSFEMLDVSTLPIGSTFHILKYNIWKEKSFLFCKLCTRLSNGFTQKLFILSVCVGDCWRFTSAVMLVVHLSETKRKDRNTQKLKQNPRKCSPKTWETQDFIRLQLTFTSLTLRHFLIELIILKLPNIFQVLILADDIPKVSKRQYHNMPIYISLQ